MTTATPAAPAPSPATPAEPTPRPRRRWVRWTVALLGLLLVAVWLAPTIVAQTALKQQIPRMLFPTYPGTIAVGEAQLDWLQPVVVHDVVAEDDQGLRLLEVKQFSTQLPLWKLALNPKRLGTLILTDPRLSVELRSEGSNLEDALSRFLAGPASTPPDFDLEVRGGTLALSHKQAALASEVSPVALLLQSRRGRIEEVELTLGTIPTPGSDDDSLHNWLAVRYGSEPTQEGVAVAPGEKLIRLKADAWNVSPLLPLLKRWEPGAELTAIIDADARAQFLPDAGADWLMQDWSWDGRITVRTLILAGLSTLKNDRLTLPTTSVAGRLAARQGRLSMDQVQVQTEVGELTATGEMPLAGLAGSSPVSLVGSLLSDQDYDIRGHVDLQRLAAVLPNTLRIREGTEITGGRLDCILTSTRDEAGQRRWQADTGFDTLQARQNGMPLSWDNPVRLSVAAHRQDDASWTIDRLNCASDFLTVTGKGTLQDSQFTATGDLSLLRQNLEKFIDLGLDQLAGKIRAQGHIRRESGDEISVQSVVQLDEFQWDVSPTSSWQEPRLVLSLTAAGQANENAVLQRIDTAELKLTSGADTMVSTLLAPVDVTRPQREWAFTTNLQGNLTTWQNRLQPIVGNLGWQLGGTAQIDAEIATSEAQVDIRRFTGTFTALDARSPDWWIKEPQVKVETAGQWSRKAASYSSPQTTVTGTALTCRLKDLVVDLDPAGGLERVAGDAAYRGDLDKLSRWKNQALPRPSYHLMGLIEGRSHLVHEVQAITANVDARITNLVVADLETTTNQQLHWVALWREPELRVLGKGSYQTEADSFRLDEATLTASGLNLAAHGSLANLSGAQQIDLQGELGYDWDLLQERLGESVRKSIRLRGKQTRPLSLQGSLASLTRQTPGQPAVVDLKGDAGLGWDSAIVAGMPLGPADASAHMEQGICQFSPISTTVGTGRVQLTPQLRLDRNPMMLVLPQEKVMDQVHMTPELCNTWLKYVAPLLADATQIDGKFSLDMQAAALPLSDMTGGQAAGTLGVHHVKVRPGGAALQITGLIDQVKAILQRQPAGGVPAEQVWMQMPAQGIPFRLAGRRIFHESATFSIGEATVQSTGSVGLDESIDLVLQVPIQDDWIRDQKLLAGLKGKSLRIPVRGTLTRPQIDSRVLTELASQIGGTALEGVIENKLDDLFKKKLNQFLPGQK